MSHQMGDRYPRVLSISLLSLSVICPVRQRGVSTPYPPLSLPMPLSVNRLAPLAGYFAYCKKLGYLWAHIWACPPSEGDDYIFHSHPPEQKVPKPKRLQEWYKKMLDKVSRIIDKVNRIIDMRSRIIDKVSRIIDKRSRIIDKRSRVIDKVSRIIDKVSRIIDNVSRIIDKRSRIIDKVSQIIDKVSRIIDKVSRIIDKRSRIIDKVSRIIDKRSRIIDKRSRIISPRTDLTGSPTTSPILLAISRVNENSPSVPTDEPLSSIR